VAILEDPEELLAELVQSLHRRMIECVHPVVQQHGIAPVGIMVLRNVQTTPGETVSDIARRTEIAKSHISNTVEQLSRQGFLEKRSDMQDRRLVRLYPTDKARALGEEILREARRSLRSALDQVPPQTVADLLVNLRTVLDAFGRRATEPCLSAFPCPPSSNHSVGGNP